MPNKKIHDDGFLDELPEFGGYGSGGPDPLLVKFADELKANRGRWKAYPRKLTRSSVPTVGQNIRRGAMGAFPKGEFEASSRAGVLYVRAVPK